MSYLKHAFFCSLLLAAALTGRSEQSESGITLAGIVKSRTADSISFTTQGVHKVFESTRVYRVFVDRQGRFYFHFSTERPFYGSLSYDRRSSGRLYLEQGDSLMVSLDNVKPIDEHAMVLDFTGKGAGNNWFLQQFDIISKSYNKSLHDFDIGAPSWDSTGFYFRASANRFRYMLQQLCLADSKRLSASFLKQVRAIVDYNWGTELMLYPQLRSQQSKQLSAKKNDVAAMYTDYPAWDKSYYDFIDSLPLNRDDLAVLDEYQTYANVFIRYKAWQTLHDSGQLPEGYLMASGTSLFGIPFKYLLAAADKQLKGRTRDALMTTYSMQALNDASRFMDCQEEILSFLNAETDGQLRSFLENKYKLVTSLARGALAPEFTLVDANGQKVSLSQLKGKVVLLDFWASWCGWCRREFPYARALKQYFNGKDFEYVFVSVDTKEDKAKWLQAIEKDKTNSFINLWAPYEMGAPRKDDVINSVYLGNYRGLPRFFLIGKDGKIVDANAKRPHTSFNDDMTVKAGGLIDDIQAAMAM